MASVENSGSRYSGIFVMENSSIGNNVILPCICCEVYQSDNVMVCNYLTTVFEFL